MSPDGTQDPPDSLRDRLKAEVIRLRAVVRMAHHEGFMRGAASPSGENEELEWLESDSRSILNKDAAPNEDPRSDKKTETEA
jgi:hypothetical protein